MLPFVSESDKEVLKQLALDRTGKDFNLYYKVRNNVYNFCKCIFIAKMMDGGYDMNFYAGTVLNWYGSMVTLWYFCVQQGGAFLFYGSK